MTHDVVVSGADSTSTDLGDGVTLVQLDAPSGRPVEIVWSIPLGDAIAWWTPNSRLRRDLPYGWEGASTSTLVTDCPVGVLLDAASRSTHAWACSRLVEPVEIAAGTDEERGDFHVRLRYVSTGERVEVRLDDAERPYEEALARIGQWWREGLPATDGRTLLPGAPDVTREPLYSTWYAFHQELQDTDLEEELTLAADLGFASVVVDDGWQTERTDRGYDTAGDWRTATSRFPDARAHVERVHALGLQEFFWIALPFVGQDSDAAHAFAGQFLPDGMASVWDVRLPAVRQHLRRTCVDLVRDLGLDGLKIDFVDAWAKHQGAPVPTGADTPSMMAAVDRLLGDITEGLREFLDEPFVEFRQRYVGPAVLRYGNVVRVSDCPMDGTRNRIAIADLRHLVGDRVVQSDMAMWGPGTSLEAIAEQLLATTFSVPQFSMRLSRLSPEEREVVRTFLEFWRTHRAVLLHGEFSAPRPDLGYPLLSAALGVESVTVVFDAATVATVRTPRAVVANAGGQDTVVVETTAAQTYRIVDARGRTVGNGRGEPGVHRLAVPRGGKLELTT